MKVVHLFAQEKSARQITLNLGVGKMQIESIPKMKAEHLHVYAGGTTSDLKRKLRKTEQGD